MDKGKINEHFNGHYQDFFSKYLPSGIKKTGGDEFQARCPFHDDKNPSMSINAKTGAYFCHGCGSKGGFIGFYARLHGLDDRRDFPRILAGIARDFGIGAGEVKAKTVKTYNYTDETDTLLFQVCRLEPKSFRQRVPNKAGGWTYNLNGVKRVLYRLPSIIKADEVVVVEGEKDADTLAALGFTSTTSPMGAKKWRAEYSDSLRNKDVTLIPDNDKEGREHMAQVGAALQGIARSVKWIDLPGLPIKGDATDWAQTFPTKEEAAERLAMMIEAAAPYEAAKAYSLENAGHNALPVARAETESEKRLDFPDIMTGAAGEFSEIYAASLEVPQHFLFIAYLTCLGSIIAHRVTLNSEIAPQPRLFVVLLGESADDRKSTALSKTTAFFREALTDFRACWGIGSAEGLQKLMEQSPNLLLCFDEFKQFISKCKIDGSVLLPCVNTLFESNRYQNITSKSEVNLEHAYLSMLAASTVQTYERTWDSSFTDIGFNNRLFLVPGSGEKKFSFPRKIAFEDKTKLKNRLGAVLQAITEGMELDITPEAATEYHRWYMSLERSIHAKRLDTYAMRFMLLHAVNERRDRIDRDIVDKVIRLMDWQLEVRRMHDPIDADGQAAKMEEKIRRLLRAKGPLTDRDLKRHAHVDRTGLWVYQMAIRNLQIAREIRWRRTEKDWQLV